MRLKNEKIQIIFINLAYFISNKISEKNGFVTERKK